MTRQNKRGLGKDFDGRTRYRKFENIGRSGIILLLLLSINCCWRGPLLLTDLEVPSCKKQFIYPTVQGVFIIVIT